MVQADNLYSQLATKERRKTMKRLKHLALALLLPVMLLLSVGAQAAAGQSYALLPRVRAYDGEFVDVDPASWYFDYAVSCYEYGLFNGRGNGFDPDADITLAELLALSARIHAAYVGDTIPAEDDGLPWVWPYAVYLEEKGIFDTSVVGWVLPATRAQLAAVFALTLPAECYSAPNDALVTRAHASGNYIPDVNARTPYSSQILWMYRQGLLSGMDGYGSYWPDKTTTRAEVAAVVMRIVDPSLRITLSWNLEGLPGGTSSAGRTLASLVKAPDHVPYDFSYDDDAAVDAFVRRMLAAGENTITLHYSGSYTDSDVSAIAERFVHCVKRYCEQMYNSVSIRAENWTGTATLSFSATACSGSQLARYREQTMAKAIEVHDTLWETGQLTPKMSQYEIARVYFRWLCEHCVYDHSGASDDYSISHIAYDALINGKAVCDGYTGAYNLFLKLEGIDCYALANDAHIWTVATLDGVEYHIDTTWGDQTGYIDMRYFAMTPAQSARVHHLVSP